MEAFQLFLEAKSPFLRHHLEDEKMASRQDSPAIINEDGDPNTLQEMVDADSMGDMVEEDLLTLDPSMLSPSIAFLFMVTFSYIDLSGNL